MAAQPDAGVQMPSAESWQEVFAAGCVNMPKIILICHKLTGRHGAPKPSVEEKSAGGKEREKLDIALDRHSVMLDWGDEVVERVTRFGRPNYKERCTRMIDAEQQSSQQAEENTARQEDGVEQRRRARRE